jgi:ribonuclease HI
MRAVAYIDGSSLQNPTYAAIAVRIYDESGLLLASICEPFGIQTNNYAEYYALVRCLEEAHQLNITDLRVVTDSELVVKQWNGEYECRSDNLRELLMYARELAQTMNVTIEYASSTQEERLRLTNQMAQEAAKHVQRFGDHYTQGVDDDTAD